MILPLIDYSDIVYATGNAGNLKKLNTLQNKAIRIIGKMRKRTNTDEKRNKLKILELKKRRLIHSLQYAYKLSQIQTQRKVHGKNTRFSKEKFILNTLPVHSDTYAKSFDYKSRVYWNNLPKSVHKLRDKKEFNCFIKRNIDQIFNDLSRIQQVPS